MIKFIHYINKELEQQFESDIRRYYKEVRKLLPDLPKDIKIYFMSGGIVYGMHTGGFAYSPEIISISIDSKAKDLDDLRHDLRATVFHEAFHVVRGYTGATGPFRLIENAVQEGAATVFEQLYADSKSVNLFGNYQQHSEKELKAWLVKIKTFKDAKNIGREKYNAIAYYDESDDVRWKLYKTGTWLVDKYLLDNRIDIKDLSNQDVEAIVSSS